MRVLHDPLRAGHKGPSLLKARGVNHDTELSALEIDSKGLRLVGDRFKDLRGVITGLPVREEK